MHLAERSATAMTFVFGQLGALLMILSMGVRMAFVFAETADKKACRIPI
jgi:hypothetical protein